MLSQPAIKGTKNFTQVDIIQENDYCDKLWNH